MKQFLNAALAAVVLAMGSVPAQAANVSFTGSLAGDNAVQLFTFTLDANSTVSLRTWSYAGGINAAGSLIGAGGFDTVLALFSGLGAAAVLIDGNDDGIGVAIDPSTGSAFDSLLDPSPLLAGTYTLALTQVANFANGPTLGDGFLGFGTPGFGGRSSAWAVDILGVTSAAFVPEPTTLALAMLGLAAAAAAGLGRPRLRG